MLFIFNLNPKNWWRHHYTTPQTFQIPGLQASDADLYTSQKKKKDSILLRAATYFQFLMRIKKFDNLVKYLMYWKT